MNIPNLIGWAFVTFFSLFNLCYYAHKHGFLKTGRYNFWLEVISVILNLGLFVLVGWK